ncbi:MAG: MFS transporter [Anaerolineae bacterium]|nr:MFS transporter [Anaerolineae bacterium]
MIVKPKRSPVQSVIRQIVVIYFLTFAARGLVVPFANLYLKDSGFSGTAIGLITGIGALLQLTLPPLLNTWADRAGRHRFLLRGFIVSNVAALVGLITFTSQLWLGGAMLFRNTADRPTDPLLAQLTISWLNRQKRDIYGRLRAWGSLGWGMVTMLSGRIFALGGYSLLFGIAALLNLLALRFISILPAQTAEKEEREQGTVPRRRGFYMLLVSLFLYFTGMTATYTFQFIYFEDNLGASKEMIGILASVAALAEIPSMMVIDALLRRVRVLFTLIIGSSGMIGLWVSFALLTDATLLIPLMIVRGTFYTLQSVSITLLIARISHPVNAATNQSLALVTVPSLAVLVTGPISGWMFDELGGQVLFLTSSVIGVLSILVMIAARRYLTVE